MATPVTVKVSIQDDALAPKDGVRVRIYEADGTTFVAQELTGFPFAAGEAEFTLDGDVVPIDYIVRMSLAGWRIVQGGTHVLSISDVPDPQLYGPYDIVFGPSQVVISVVASTDDVVPVLIDGVQVQLYDGSDVYLGEAVTGAAPDPAGTATLMATGSVTPGTLHLIRVKKEGVTFIPGPTQEINVIDPLGLTETNVFDVVGHIETIPESDDVDLCRLTAYMTDVSLRPLPGIVVKFIPVLEFPTLNPVYSGYFIGNPAMVRGLGLYAPVEVVTDDDGYLEIDLPRNGIFDIHVHGFEHPLPITERIVVPDEPGFLLYDLLLKYVMSVSIAPAILSIQVGESSLVDLVITGSDEVVLTDPILVNTLLEVKSSNEAVMSVSLTGALKVAVYGVSAGTASIVITRKPHTVATRRPAVAAIVVTVNTITVS